MLILKEAKTLGKLKLSIKKKYVEVPWFSLNPNKNSIEAII